MLMKMIPPSTHLNNLIDVCVKKKLLCKKKTTLDLFNNQSSDLCPCHNKDGMS